MFNTDLVLIRQHNRFVGIVHRTLRDLILEHRTPSFLHLLAIDYGSLICRNLKDK